MVVIDVIISCICLHNLMRMHYPALQNAALDAEDDPLNLIPGDWRNAHSNARCSERRWWKQSNTSCQSAD